VIVSKKNEERNVTRVDTLCNELGVPPEIRVNDKQLRFCLLYVETLDATGSYMEVFGCTYDSAKANSSRLIANDNIKQCIHWIVEKNSDNIDISHGEIMNGIKEIALDKSVSAGTRLKAYELLAKVKGITQPEVEISMPVIKVTISDDDIPLLDDGNIIDGNFTDID
jgi:hypothetical protein